MQCERGRSGEDEHSNILDCIEAGDAAGAIAGAMKHLDGIEATFKARALMTQTAKLEDIWGT
jgi:DNA-binding GntR family transcriptional regulator